MLAIIAPDDKIKEKYMEPVLKAQATVEFPPDYRLPKEVENIKIPRECTQHTIKSIILKETKSKKN